MEAQVYNSSTQEIRQEDSKFKGREGRREERLSGEERDGTSLFRTIRKKSGLGTLKKKNKTYFCFRAQHEHKIQNSSLRR